MTGVSYMIPFVAAGGLLIALSFLFGGYEIVGPLRRHPRRELAHQPARPPALGLDHALFDSGFFAYLGAIFFVLGKVAFAFFIPALAGYIAYAIADRPGIAPGFVMGGLAADVMQFGLPRPASWARSSAASSPASWRTGSPAGRCRSGRAA